MGKYTSIATLSLVMFAVTIVSNNAIVLKVYCQATMTECNKFIIDQLHPTFSDESFAKSVEVKLVPYGNAFKQQLVDDKWQLQCNDNNNGSSCLNNKIHACAIVSNNWKSLNFIKCLTTMGDNIDNISKCAIYTCFSKSNMPSCVNTVDGDELLIGHGLDTQALNVSLANLPIVTFDGVYKEEEQQRARDNLLALVCEKTGNKAQVCASPRAKRVMTHDNFGTGKYYRILLGC